MHALLCDGFARLEISLELQRAGLVLELLLALATVPDHATCHVRPAEEHPEESEVRERDGCPGLDRSQWNRNADEDDAHRSPEAARIPAGRVDPDHDSDQERAGLCQALEHGVVELDHHEPDCEHGDRGAASKSERGREADGDGHAGQPVLDVALERELRAVERAE